MNYEKVEGNGIQTNVYVSDGYLYLNWEKNFENNKTMQIRPEKRILYKIQENAQNVRKSSKHD